MNLNTLSSRIAATQNVAAIQIAAMQDRSMMCSVDIITHVNGHRCRNVEFPIELKQSLFDRPYGNIEVTVLRLNLHAGAIGDVFTQVVDEDTDIGVVGVINFAHQGKRVSVQFNPLLIGNIMGTYGVDDGKQLMDVLPHINLTMMYVGQEYIHNGYASNIEEAAVMLFGDEESINEYREEEAKKPVGFKPKLVDSESAMEGFDQDLPRPTTPFTPTLVN